MNKRLWISVLGSVAVAFALAVGTAQADPPHGGRGDRGDRGPGPRAGSEHMDARFGHNHYYPSRGYEVRDLPRDRFEVNRFDHRYYYSGGIWYEPRGPSFVVVGPPIGVFVPVLPSSYTTVYFGGAPYYYANDTYYTWRPDSNQYEVVDPPGDDNAAQTQAPPSDDVFIYPKNGQSEEQQAKDKYECHKWASDQSGFDPTQSGGGVPADQSDSRREAYQRAMGACLDGRGYSVK
jgi:Family of unknown function (DUF6515)